VDAAVPADAADPGEASNPVHAGDPADAAELIDRLAGAGLLFREDRQYVSLAIPRDLSVLAAALASPP
jgi:hypothetical protein